MVQERLDFTGEVLVAGRRLAEEGVARRGIAFERGVEEGADGAPAFRIHVRGCPSSSRASHARASAQ
jgi:hypothetical protein